MDKRQLLSFCCATALYAPAALAQTATGASAATPESGDIIVTAQRREQRLQDVPVSISVLSGDSVQRMGATNITDVIAGTAGIQSQAPAGNSGFPVYNIRGVTLLDFSYTSEASVAIYADEVYLGNAAFATQQLFDLDRVEILKGPQGTLYGRNATGGLVHYISRRPTDTMTGSALVQYGSFHDVVLEGAISGPVSDKIRVRVAGRYNSNNGWQVNQTTGTRLASVDHAIGIRATVEADLSPDVLMTLSGNYSDTEGSEDGRASFGLRQFDTNLADGINAPRCSNADILASFCYNGANFRDPNPDPRKPYSDLAQIPYAMRSTGASAKFVADLGFAKLTSITAYLWGRKIDGIDVDAAPVSQSNLAVQYFARHRQFSQELRLGGDVGRFNWLAGSYYYADKRFYTALFPANTLGNYTDQKINSISGFAQGTYSLTSTLNVTGGIRYTKDKKKLLDLAAVSGGVTGTRLGTNLASFGAPLTGEINASKVTWKLGTDWHVTPGTMLFATVSTGFKTGGYNTSFVFTRGETGPVKPETITTYEIGVKSQLIDRLLTLNLTGYYNDYADIQAAASVACAPNCPSPGVTTVTQYINIGSAKVYGAEMDLLLRPATDVTIQAGAAYNHNKLTAPPTTTIGGVAINGNRLVNTPSWSLSGMFNWQPSLGNGNGHLVVGGDVKYQTKIFFRPDNTPLAVQGGYALVGARLGWATDNDDIRIEGYARNLFNQEYFTSRTALAESAPGTWGRPREIGIRVSGRF
jgi:iron complex outermembrane receptor protein